MAGFSVVFSSLALLPGVASIVCTFRSPPYAWPLSAACNGLMVVSWALQGSWPWVAFNGALGLFALWMWWRNRRGRGRARAVLSGKYRHVRDAMVRTLRERRTARPVLAPGRA